MSRLIIMGLGLAAGVLGLIPTASAELLSQKYAYKSGVILDIGAATAGGLRLDNVRFQAPSKIDGKIVQLGGVFTAEVAVSNTGSQTAKAGVAIALFDSQGRLVGVADGGTKLSAIKPGRQKSFTLVFDGVKAEADSASEFHISIESKP